MDAAPSLRIRRGSWGLALVAVALVLAACSSPLVRPGASFRPTPSPMPTFDPEQTGFDGLVIDGSGEPVAGVHLVLQSGGRRGTAATTDEGTFFGRGVVGEIAITASLEGHETAETTITVAPNEITDVEIVVEAEGGAASRRHRWRVFTSSCRRGGGVAGSRGTRGRCARR